MQSTGRGWLWGGIILVALVAVTVVLIVTTDDDVALLPADTPEGTVQRFLMAVQEQDYSQAYAYLSIERGGVKLSYEDWLNSISGRYPSSPPVWKATIGGVSVSGDSARVDVIIEVFEPGGPLENPVRTYRESWELRRTDGSWFIISDIIWYWLF